MARSTQMRYDVSLTESMFVPFGDHIHVADLSSVYVPECPPRASQVFLQVFVQDVRFTLDGSIPSVNHGFRLTAGDGITALPFTDQTVLSLIEESPGATLELQWGF